MTSQKEQLMTSVRETYTIPPADLLETSEHFLLLIDLPGVSKDQVAIKVRNGVLSVMGTPEQTRLKGDKLLHGEFKNATFHRNFRLSEDVVDIDKVAAHLQDGVLSMTLPKRKKNPPRRIPVRRIA